MQKLSVKGLALGCGISRGLGMIFLGWISMIGRGTGAVQGLATIYTGFDSSWIGGLIGGARGFLDGGIGGLIIAIIYNQVAKRQK